MNDTVIKVENLSKRFIISHEERERYTSLRDVIARKSKKIFSRNSKIQTTREEFWALKDLNFEIKKGDRVGIIGRNGAGKSTLLKILSRITDPTTGRVTIDGRVASLLEVGTGFHPELTGRENIFLNGAILGMGRVEIRKKFDEIVNFAEVEKFLDTPVKRYSSGMYVRLAFAVAAHLEPEILIVDEVLAVGDAQFQKKCLGKMEAVSKNEGRTVLFVSHNMDAIANLCSVGILLNKGRMETAGYIGDIISYYQSRNEIFSNNVWLSNVIGQHFHIKKAVLELTGRQPRLNLTIDVTIVGISKIKPAFIAFDIHNGMGVTVMQSVPAIEPFIKGADEQTYRTEIELTGLIPDNYSVSIWIGPHNDETYDWQKKILGFEVLQSPTKGRTFPHHYGHGYIVPESRIQSL